MGRMGGHYLGLAKHAAEAAYSGRIAANKAKPIKHGLSAYRAGKCRCREICLPAHRAAVADLKARKAAGLPVGRQVNAVDPVADAFALSLLKDGATYREAATSAGVDQVRLANRYPDYKSNRSEFATVMSQIRNNPKLLALHREIWQNPQEA